MARKWTKEQREVQSRKIKRALKQKRMAKNIAVERLLEPLPSGNYAVAKGFERALDLSVKVGSEMTFRIGEVVLTVRAVV